MTKHGYEVVAESSSLVSQVGWSHLASAKGVVSPCVPTVLVEIALGEVFKSDALARWLSVFDEIPAAPLDCSAFCAFTGTSSATPASGQESKTGIVNAGWLALGEGKRIPVYGRSPFNVTFVTQFKENRTTPFAWMSRNYLPDNKL